jgi:radical SAM superfamily enzyme YgiQ (UPF0313 family)
MSSDKLKILLINPLLAPKRLPAVYNIGLAYIASSLLQEGHHVSVLDIEGHRYADDHVIEIIKQSDCDVIGIGTLITGYRRAKWLVKTIRLLKPGIPIWIGNSISSSIPEIILTDMDVDVAVIGEGENTVKELAEGIMKNRNLHSVKGIAFREDGRIIRNEDRELISDIDAIPFPAWDLFPQEIFMNNKAGHLPTPTAYIVTTRGCPYQCTYCYHPFQNERIRMHSSQRIVDEVKYLRKRYGIRSFVFADDLFVVNKKRVYEICDLFHKEQINLQWITSARVNLVDEELLYAMKEAGCIALGFGVESGSQKILDNIKKNVTVEQARIAIELCKKVGINPVCSYMIGNVGETRDTIFETVSFIRENTLEQGASFFITTPYPGTEIYELAKQAGKIKDEVALFESYGEQSESLLVNLTDLPNETLLNLKREAEDQIWRAHKRKYPLKYIVSRFEIILGIYKLYGFWVTIFKLMSFIRNKLKHDKRDATKIANDEIKKSIDISKHT